jgi:hypothetical protein
MQFGKAAAHLHLPYYKQQYKDKETNLEVAFLQTSTRKHARLLMASNSESNIK